VTIVSVFLPWNFSRHLRHYRHSVRASAQAIDRYRFAPSRKEFPLAVGSHTLFDYVSGITIGSIGAELATEIEEPYKPLTALAIYGLASLVLNLIAHRLPKTRKYINGSPTILMNDGKLYRKNLKQAKLDLSEFMLLCREQGYFDLDEIQTAIFEHNGKLSILPKAANRPATPEDLKITAKATRIGVEVIMDGRVMGENLSRIGRDMNWLIKQLKTQGHKDAKEIFLGIYRPDEDKLTLYPNE